MHPLLSLARYSVNLAALQPYSKTLPNVAGIYAIRHVPTDLIYVGSTRNKFGLQIRALQHAGGLKKGISRNNRLQSLFNETGLSSFEFHVLFLLPAELVRQEESRLIQKYRLWETGLNLSYRACGGVSTESSRQKLREANQGTFRLKKDGKIYEGVNLAALAKSLGLHQGALAQVNLGKMRQYKGWRHPDTDDQKFLVKNPEGDLVEVPHHRAASYARSLGLDPCIFNKLRHDANRLHRGWSHNAAKFSTEERTMSIKKKWVSEDHRNSNTKPFEVWKDGEVYRGTNRSEFCRLHGMPTNVISLLEGGVIKSRNGFTCRTLKLKPRPKVKRAHV